METEKDLLVFDTNKYTKELDNVHRMQAIDSNIYKIADDKVDLESTGILTTQYQQISDSKDFLDAEFEQDEFQINEPLEYLLKNDNLQK